MNAASPNKNKDLSVLLSIEQDAYAQNSWQELIYVIVNMTHKIAPYQRGLFFEKTQNGFKLSGASAQTEIDRQVSFARWAEKLVAKNINETIRVLDKKTLSDEDQKSWDDWCAKNIILVPLYRNKKCLGVLWIERDALLDETETAKINHLCHCYASCLYSLKDKEDSGMLCRVKSFLSNRRKMTIAIVLLVLFFFPVRFSSLVPAEVVAKAPRVITAPVDGMIGDVLIEPYETVNPGDVLFSFDREDWDAEYRILQEQIGTSEAKWQTALRHAFKDEKSKRDIQILSSEVEEKKANQAALRSVIERGRVKAPQAGTVVFDSAYDLIGKYVRVGEKVMMVANPDNVELLIRIPADNMIHPNKEVAVSFLPDMDPLNDWDAKIRYVSYEASQDPDGLLTFKSYADFEDTNDLIIGSKGMVRVYGDFTILGYQLFRKPINVLRRTLGW